MFLSPFGKVKNAALNSLQGATLPIAIDFGAGSLKVLQLQSGDPPQLIAAALLPTPDALMDDPAKRFAFQFQALPKLIKSVAFKGKRAVVSLPAAQLFCKHLQLPRTESVPVSELVENAVPAILECPQQALVYRHVVVDGAQPCGQTSGSVGALAGDKGLGASGPKQEVICLAASRDMVGRMLQACKDAKLELVGMQPEFFCTLRAFEHLSRRADDAGVSTIYIDVGLGTTKIIIENAGKLVFAKSIQLGGIDLDKAAAHMLNCALGAAHQRRIEALGRDRVRSVRPAQTVAAARSRRTGPAEDGHGPAVADDRRSGLPAPMLGSDLTQLPLEPVSGIDIDLSESLEILEDEIAMCVRYYESIFPGRKIARAVFLGGESLHRGLCQHVARRLRLPAQLADPLASIARTGDEPAVNVDFSLQQPGWAVPLGLSLLPTDL